MRNEKLYESKFRNQTMEQKHKVETWLPEAKIELVRHPSTDEYCVKINLGVHQGVSAKERKNKLMKFIEENL